MYSSKNIVVAALAMFVMEIVSAQSYGEILGKVYDGDGNPIIGAIVTVTAGADMRGDATNFDGQYHIKPLMPATYTVEIRSTGKQTVFIDNVHVDAEKIAFAPNVTMFDSVYTTGPVVIEARRVTCPNPLIDKNGGNIFTMRAKEMKNLPSANGGNIKSIVASMTSDVKTSASGDELYFRGSRNGSTLYYIDGVKISAQVPNIPSSGISSIQVYTGGLPAKYGDCTGGVVVIETKSYLEDYYDKLNP